MERIETLGLLELVGGTKLSHNGDMPRSTKVKSTGAPQNRQVEAGVGRAVRPGITGMVPIASDPALPHARRRAGAS